MFKHIVAIGITALLCNPAAFAAYPESPVTIVVPFPAGQAGDLIARTMGAELAQKTGQSFIIENRPGAGGRVGTASVARAKSDGYTLLLTSSGPFAIAPALYPDTIQYDPVKNFAAVADMGSTPQVLAVSNASGIKSVAELLSSAKVKDLSYASAGNGSTQHLTMELLKLQLQFPMVHVPFKGSSEAKTQIMSGLIPVTSESLPSILPQIKAGQLRALAIVDTERSPYLAQVPTLSELGYPKISTVAFFGLVAPIGTPQPILDMLNAQVREIMKHPKMQEKFRELALTPPRSMTSDQFRQYLSAEVDKWKQVVVNAKVVVD